MAFLQTQLFVEQRGKPAEDELSAWGQVRPVPASAAAILIVTIVSTIKRCINQRIPQHMGVVGLHDPILAAAGEGLVSFVFSCQVPFVDTA
jgi:hypothetical protein